MKNFFHVKTVLLTAILLVIIAGPGRVYCLFKKLGIIFFSVTAPIIASFHFDMSPIKSITAGRLNKMVNSSFASANPIKTAPGDFSEFQCVQIFALMKIKQGRLIHAGV
jgi:hypothetical protein